jgi:N-acetyl-gamma-glutamyl-phosphate reductase
MIKAGIIGGAGYTGGELLRLLIHHPQVEIGFVHSNSNAGNPIYKVHADLFGDTNLHFTATLSNDIDVLFLCVGHGEAIKFLSANPIASNVKIIDLSQDFRLKENATFQDRNFVYGLPELNKPSIQKAQNIANPGCFATAIQLSLLPLANAGCLNEVNITGITGSTGAGQSLSASSHFSWRANNIQAYKTLTHQHLLEIGESLLQLQPESVSEINFIPWRGDFTRGIFASTVLHCTLEEEELKTMFTHFYANHPFTHLSNEPISLKQVVNTNKCLLQIEKVANKLVVHVAIDNLLKGASGQALQNMNLMFGLDETIGLQLKANFF